MLTYLVRASISWDFNAHGATLSLENVPKWQCNSFPVFYYTKVIINLVTTFFNTYLNGSR